MIGVGVGLVGVVAGFMGLSPQSSIMPLVAAALLGVGSGLSQVNFMHGTAFFGTLFLMLPMGARFGWIAALLTFATMFVGYFFGQRHSDQTRALFGSSRWAKVDDLDKAGMMRPGGLFLGTLNGRDIYQHGEDSVLTVAPQGSGKSSCLAIPTLLTYPGSVVVTDPKGELAANTAAVRRAMGQRVIILNPFRAMLAAGGLDLPDDGFNPLSFFPPGPGMGTAARALTSVIAPEKPREDDFFAPASRDLLAALLYYVLTTCTGRKRSLAHVRALLMQPPAAFRTMLDEEWLASDDDTLIQNAGAMLGDMESVKTWGSIKRGAMNALSIYESELADHISRGDLPPDLFKREAVSVYIILPGDQAASHAGWFRLVASVLCQAVGRPGPSYQVLFLCDEFANLGPAHSILRSIALYRSAGLKAWLLVQNIGQLKRIYEQGSDEVLSLCRTKQFFDVPQGDKELAEFVSKATGDVTVLNPSWNQQDQTRSLGQTGVPLLRSEDVPRLPKGDQIVFNGNLPAIKARLVSFRDRPAWARLASRRPPRPSSRSSVPYSTGKAGPWGARHG